MGHVVAKNLGGTIAPLTASFSAAFCGLRSLRHAFRVSQQRVRASRVVTAARWAGGTESGPGADAGQRNPASRTLLFAVCTEYRGPDAYSVLSTMIRSTLCTT